MRFVRTAAIALAALALPASAQAPAALAPKLLPQTAAAPAAATPTGSASLTKADVDTWLDGLVPYGIAVGDIPGAVVVVVKDGQVLTARGFGFADKKAQTPVDPARTLFRPGSTSKLFTWTAVMQLVQAHKLDLDRDINTYLDFTIPPAFGKPITLRNLMTHTAGFEETVKGLITYDPKQNPPLDQVLKRWVPARIFAPGSTPAYSNYGASLAGYIVQRVSGEPFDDYVQRHIMAPAGMTHSTFAQPLPAAWAVDAAKGYDAGSDTAKPYEIIPLAPAGALAATGTDMARFMIAHLNHGGPLLSPQTEALMVAPANAPIAALPAMALGFYHEDRNGHIIVGHGGDTIFFHSDLHLYLNDDVGLFLSFNSPGKDGAAHVLRARLFEAFTDRYFPQAQPVLPTIASAHAHGAAMAGHYTSTRGSLSNFLKLVSVLGEPVIALNPDDTITVSALTDPAGNPKKWREIAPWVWQEVGGTSTLHALVKDGKVRAFLNSDLPQIFLFTPAPASLDAGWLLPALFAALAIMALTALGWPLVAIVRRAYRYRAPLAGRALMLHRATRIGAWAWLAVAGAWTFLISMIDSHLEDFNDGMNIWLRLIQLVTVGAIVGTGLACWNAVVTVQAPERRWWKYGWAILVALAGLFLIWVVLTFNLITLALDY